MKMILMTLKKILNKMFRKTKFVVTPSLMYVVIRGKDPDPLIFDLTDLF